MPGLLAHSGTVRPCQSQTKERLFSGQVVFGLPQATADPVVSVALPMLPKASKGPLEALRKP